METEFMRFLREVPGYIIAEHNNEDITEELGKADINTIINGKRING
jgi:hypothetical protein